MPLGLAFGFFKPVDMPDVGVIEAGEDLGFALEAGQAVGVGRERFREHLERHLPVELRVAGAVDLTL